MICESGEHFSQDDIGVIAENNKKYISFNASEYPLAIQMAKL